MNSNNIRKGCDAKSASNHSDTCLDSRPAVGLPLSAAQLGIWYAIKAGTSASAYSIAEYTRIFGSIDKGLFETALRQLISEVEVLRLRFFESDGAVRQRVAEPDEWRLSYLDVTREADPLRAAETWMQADAAESVSVEQWPLFGPR